MVTKLKNKGNIPVDKKLLSKYDSVKRIFKNTNLDKNYIKMIDIPNFNKFNLDSIKIEEFKKLCNSIFNEYNNVNYFLNNGNKIYVSKSGINESAQKIFNNRLQRNYIKEHLIVFANLNLVIENAILVNQVLEHKSRSDIFYWNYYVTYISIANNLYVVEFEVRSMLDGQNQYRIQRLEIKCK